MYFIAVYFVKCAVVDTASDCLGQDGGGVHGQATWACRSRVGGPPETVRGAHLAAGLSRDLDCVGYASAILPHQHPSTRRPSGGA